MSNLLVQNIKHTNGTTAQTIDSSGNTTVSQNLTVSGSEILTPARPCFYVRNLNFPYQTGGIGTGGTVDINVGSHYNSSNGRFTAPVAGIYMMMMMTQYYDGSTGSYITCKLYKNGSNLGNEAYQGFGNANHAQAYLNTLVSLNVGDFVEAYTDFGARDIQNYFQGYLVG